MSPAASRAARLGALTDGAPVSRSENVNAYCLHIAEDDGEVDTDFPPLDSNEPIHKFGFSTLALVEKFSSPGLASRQSLFVRMCVGKPGRSPRTDPESDAASCFSPAVETLLTASL